MVNENALFHLKGEKGKVACGIDISERILFKLLYVNNCIKYVAQRLKLEDILRVDTKNKNQTTQCSNNLLLNMRR